MFCQLAVAVVEPVWLLLMRPIWVLGGRENRLAVYCVGD